MYFSAHVNTWIFRIKTAMLRFFISFLLTLNLNYVGGGVGVLILNKKKLLLYKGSGHLEQTEIERAFRLVAVLNSGISASPIVTATNWDWNGARIC